MNAEYLSDAVPIVAVFTKFDDLVVQVYDSDRGLEESCADACKIVKEKFETPLETTRNSPKAYVCFNGAFISSEFQALLNNFLFQPFMKMIANIRIK